MVEVSATINIIYYYSNTLMLFLGKPNVFQQLPSSQQRTKRLKLHTHMCMHADILCNSNNLLYHYKFVMHLSKVPIWYIITVYTECCLQYIKYAKLLRAHFDPNAFEVSITNIVSNIYRNINKSFPILLFILLDRDFYMVIYFLW